MKLASAMTAEALRVLEAESGAIARAAGPGTGLSGVLSHLSPQVRPGRAWQYSLKAPEGSGPVMKLMHYGVQPAMLGKTISDTAGNIRELRSITPEHLVRAGLSPVEAEKVYRKARGRVLGHAAGDAASWALYPLSIANPVLHYPLVGAGSVFSPRLGEMMGRQLAS